MLLFIRNGERFHLENTSFTLGYIRTIDISDPKNETIAEKYEVTWSSLFVSKWKDGKETYENLTEYAFANARTAPDTFKNGITEKVRTLLK